MPTVEEERIRGNLTTTFKFLTQIDNVDNKEFFEICKERASRDHSEKSSKKLVRIEIKKHCHSIRAVSKCNKIDNENLKTCVLVKIVQEMGAPRL